MGANEDLNSDGKSDLIFLHKTKKQVSLQIMNGVELVTGDHTEILLEPKLQLTNNTHPKTLLRALSFGKLWGSQILIVMASMT